MPSRTRPHGMQLRYAYAVCRHIARSSARNFYYGFLVLPRHKRNALSAVYAFMRHCDDICDDPALAIEDKRTRLADFQLRAHRALAGERTDDPVLMALTDTVRRYSIPVALLDELVTGTAMDLNDEIPPVVSPRPLNAPPPVVLYPTFDELYAYCYRVASVVGLICIRIFGFRDPRAETLAEHTGVAFQLTNIIRDVREDALLGRVYLPGEDLARYGISPTQMIDGANASAIAPALGALAARAETYYAEARQLIPLVDEDARPALGAMIEIYHRLLRRIAARKFEVFGDRVRLPAREKALIMAVGLWHRLV